MKLDYFVSGSVASSYYGEYRNTLDVDIVVALSQKDAPRFCQQFPQPDWYVSEEAATQAVTRGGMFNIIHVFSGLKIDVAIAHDRPQDELRFHRRHRVTLEGGIGAWFASAEDVILSKLEFYREGGSEKHIRDISSMLKIADRPADMAYLEHWALRLGVHAEWQAIKERLKLT